MAFDVAGQLAKAGCPFSGAMQKLVIANDRAKQRLEAAIYRKATAMLMRELWRRESFRVHGMSMQRLTDAMLAEHEARQAVNKAAIEALQDIAEDKS